MSARKRATVSVNAGGEEATAELRRAAEPESLAEAVQRSTEALRQSFARLEERQQQFQQRAGGFDEEIRRLEEETGQALQKQQARLVEQIEAAAGTLSGMAGMGLESLAQELGEQMEAEQQRRREEVAQLNEELAGLNAGEQHKQEIASGWLEAARELAAFIAEAYPHEFFRPGELEKQWRRVEQAQQALGGRMAEAALMGAQQGYEGLAELRIDLERQHAEWLMLRGSAAERAARLVEQAVYNRECEALGPDGRRLGVKIDADYWSGRRISRLVETTRRVQARIGDVENAPDAGQLREILERTLPRLEAELGENLRQARLAALGAQLRINIADVVVDALKGQGFEVQEANYQQGDMRRAYQLKVCNREGSEIHVQVKPHAREVERNEVSWQSQDSGERTQHELEQRGREIERALRKRGLQVGAVAAEEEREAAEPRRGRGTPYEGRSASYGG